MNSSSELKDYLDSIYATAAQYNKPPTYPVTVVCGGIDGAHKGSHVLDRIHAGIVASQGNLTCYNTNFYNQPSETSMGWRWQVSTH